MRLFEKYCVVTMIVLLANVAGCGGPPQADYSGLGLVDVTGVLKVDGQPVAGAIVVFKDSETDGEAYGLTDDSGYYRMYFDSVEYGVMPGEKLVSFSTTKKVLGLNTGSEGGGEGEEGEASEESESTGSGAEQIPAAYVKDSPIKVTVSSSTAEFNFDLAADGSTTSAL